MDDGEVLLENSPLHQYLKEIGMADTEIMGRVETIPSAQPEHDSKPSKISTSVYPELKPGKMDELVKSFRQFFSTSTSKLRDIRQTIVPNLLNLHEDHILQLEKSELMKSTLNTSVFLLFAVAGCIITPITGYIFLTQSMITTSVYCILLLLFLYLFHSQVTLSLIPLNNYCDYLRKFKQTTKAIVSFLRDCQVAKTTHAAGLTWARLDSVESSEGSVLEHHQLRVVLFEALNDVYREHRDVIEWLLKSFQMTSDMDCVNRYLCLQDDVEIFSGSYTSHTLRYYLKLVEHVGSELLWKVVVGTFRQSWNCGEVDVFYLPTALSKLTDLAVLLSFKEHQIKRHYETLTSVPESVTLSSPSTVSDPNVDMTPGPASAGRALRHQLQILHSSLNVATLRCREVANSGGNEVGEKFISLIKINLDVAQNTLAAIECMTSPAGKGEKEKGERDGEVEEIEDKGSEVKPIEPYVQQGNMVFTGIGKENDGEEVGGLDSDDEMEINLLRHREENKLMLDELRHVMEVNPTSLYEADYDEFKKTGLLNPTKEEIREMEHRGSDAESVGSQDDPRHAPMGFNPLLFSLPPALLLQRAGGEEIVGEAFGDLSEDDENVDEGVNDGDDEDVDEGVDSTRSN